MNVLGVVFGVVSVIVMLTAWWGSPAALRRIVAGGRSERGARALLRAGHLLLGLTGFALGVVIASGVDFNQAQAIVLPVGASLMWLGYALLMPLAGIKRGAASVGARLWEDFQRGTLESSRTCSSEDTYQNPRPRSCGPQTQGKGNTMNTNTELQARITSALNRGDLLVIDTGSGILAANGPDLAQFLDELTPEQPARVLETQSMDTSDDDEVGYGWTITDDYRDTARETSFRWTTGPEDILQRQLAMLMDGAPLVGGYGRYIFRLHDEDGVILFMGNAVFREDDDHLLNALAAPLAQFGEIEGGASYITWENHPEWDIE